MHFDELQQIAKVNNNLNLYALLIMSWKILIYTQAIQTFPNNDSCCVCTRVTLSTHRSLHSSFIFPYAIHRMWVGLFVSFLRSIMYARSVPLLYFKALPMGRCVINMRLMLAGEHGNTDPNMANFIIFILWNTLNIQRFETISLPVYVVPLNWSDSQADRESELIIDNNRIEW